MPGARGPRSRARRRASHLLSRIPTSSIPLRSASTRTSPFGSGAHHCLGAFLARAELQEALRVFVERVEHFELDEPVQWKPLSMGIWGPSRMRLRLNAPALSARVDAGTMPPPHAQVDTGTSAERDRYLAEVAPLRRAIAASVPELIERPRFPPLGRLVVTAARIGWAVYAGRLLDRRLDHDERREQTYRRLRLAATKLGPAYIKLAQLIAAGEGVFPDALVAECRLCRDQVRAEPWSAIRDVVEAELGDLDSRFADFDTAATAAASIAQVHEARLADGTRVMVKVAAASHPQARRTRPRGAGVDRAQAGGSHPDHRAGEPAGAGGAVR